MSLDAYVSAVVFYTPTDAASPTPPVLPNPLPTGYTSGHWEPHSAFQWSPMYDATSQKDKVGILWVLVP